MTEHSVNAAQHEGYLQMDAQLLKKYFLRSENTADGMRLMFKLDAQNSGHIFDMVAREFPNSIALDDTAQGKYLWLILNEKDKSRFTELQHTPQALA